MMAFECSDRTANRLNYRLARLGHNVNDRFVLALFQEQRRFFEALYGDPKSGKMDVAQALTDLRDIQELIQDKYVKQSADDAEAEGFNFS